MLETGKMIRSVAIGAVLAAASIVGVTAETSKADQKFAEEAAHFGISTVAQGQLALAKSTNDQVRKFGERMLQDHQQANEALEAVSRELVLTLPSHQEASQLRTLVKLQALSGAAFDREYMQHAVASLHRSIVLYELQATAGDSAELRAYAAKTLPLLRRHLLLAESIERAVVAGAKVASRHPGMASPFIAQSSGQAGGTPASNRQPLIVAYPTPEHGPAKPNAPLV